MDYKPHKDREELVWFTPVSPAPPKHSLATLHKYSSHEQKRMNEK